MDETNKSFERHCRLCAEEQEVTLMLFSTEASDMLLIEKLQKYLLIEIDENDKLPKNICIKCCSKLQALCEFIELVRKAQDTLQALSSTIEMLDSSINTIKAIEEESTEYAEICIDPMDVLNITDENHTDQFKYPYADEIVTLKLISKHDDDQVDENTQTKKKFVCKVCNRGFLVEQSLKNHSWTHIQDEEYSCFICQRSYRFETDLNKHMRIHNSLGPGYMYSCNICGRRFKTEYTYDVHMRIHRDSLKSYTCGICGRSYANWTGLKIHSITHSSEKPFKCSICDKKFKRNQELKFHMNHHTGEKPYKCKLCDKCFASTGNLYSHKTRAHSNDWDRILKCKESQTANEIEESKKNFKYQCEICRKGCRRQENYLYHMFQHTGEKPFKCTECTQKFITQRSLSSHYDNAHPNIDKPAMPMPVFCQTKCKWL